MADNSSFGTNFGHALTGLGKGLEPLSPVIGNTLDVLGNTVEGLGDAYEESGRGESLGAEISSAVGGFLGSYGLVLQLHIEV